MIKSCWVSEYSFIWFLLGAGGSSLIPCDITSVTKPMKNIILKPLSFVAARQFSKLTRYSTSCNCTQLVTLNALNAQHAHFAQSRRSVPIVRRCGTLHAISSHPSLLKWKKRQKRQKKRRYTAIENDSRCKKESHDLFSCLMTLDLSCERETEREGEREGARER